jgi:hypothetical protein
MTTPERDAPPVPPMPGTARTNGFAVASLVLGVVGVVLTLTFRLGLISDVLAVVFGGLGMSKAREGAPDGGLAKAGLILGLVGLGLLLVMLVVVLTTGFGGHHLWFHRGYRMR